MSVAWRGFWSRFSNDIIDQHVLHISVAAFFFLFSVETFLCAGFGVISPATDNTNLIVFFPPFSVSVGVCCSVLQCSAVVRCSLLQCVAVCCKALQCDAV